QPIWKCPRPNIPVIMICGPPVATAAARIGMRPKNSGASRAPASMKRHRSKLCSVPAAEEPQITMSRGGARPDDLLILDALARRQRHDTDAQPHREAQCFELRLAGRDRARVRRAGGGLCG